MNTFGYITVYEIEHDSDLDNALQELRDAGFTSVDLLSFDYELESARFHVTFPRGFNWKQALEDAKIRT